MELFWGCITYAPFRLGIPPIYHLICIGHQSAFCGNYIQRKNTKNPTDKPSRHSCLKHLPHNHEKNKSELVGSEVQPKCNETLIETIGRQHRAHMFHQQKTNAQMQLHISLKDQILGQKL